MILPKYVMTAITLLKEHHYQAYVVGGAVRDYLLGKIPHDYDIATDAKPQEIIEIFKSYHLITQGIKHGTITVFINHEQIEITTFRIEDDYVDFRHPQKIEFVNNLYEDLSRRDFTINALAYDNQIIDFFDGEKDLRNKIIRCVGDANLRFQEDALRILRALRFACQLNFSIEEKTKEAIFNNCELLKNISYERINLEFDKMLMTNLHKYLIPYYDVFKVFIPELDYQTIQENIQILKKLPKNRIIRLAGILYLLENPSEILKRLKYPKKIQESVLNIINNVNLNILPDKKEIKKILMNLDLEDLKRIIIFQKAQGKKIKIDNILKEITNEVYSLKDLAIKGSDLVAIGVPKNEQISIFLKELLILIIEEKLPNNKEALISYVQNKINKKNTIA